MSKYILSIQTQAERLYLGYNENNQIDCVPDKTKSIIFDSEEDARISKSVLAHKNAWVVEEFE